MLAAGTQLGRYEIAAPLGAGGMGEVYRATDSRLDRQVAIKVLPPQFVQDQARLARFEREAKVVAALSHPNILGIHDFGTEQGQTFAVMELLEGETLRRRMDDGAIPWRKAVEIAVAIADGLAAAHAKGIIHRDLKPENIFLTADGRVKVLDFGLARITPVSPTGESPTGTYHPDQTEVGTILGTVGYMSPEQVRGQEADGKSDIFSLGCVLYEMVCGQHRVPRPSAMETMTAILHDEPLDLADSGRKAPLELERLIRHCLEKNPAARFHSAHDLAFALRAIQPDSKAKGSAFPKSAYWGAAALALAVIAVLGLWFNYRRPAPAGDRAFESVAVLPFENVTGDPKAESLSDGIADHLSINLSQLHNRDFKVTPFTSASRFRGPKIDLKAAGSLLGVQAVVTGKLYQEGESLLISVALSDAHADNLIWGQQYRGKRSEILALQDEIAKGLVSHLGLRLSDADERRLLKHHTDDPEAYHLYCEGQYHWRKFSEDGLKTAMEYFKRAIQKDSKYALAYTGLGQCYILLGTIHRGPLETFPEARKYVDQALAIDDTLAKAHHMLGVFYLFDDWNWPAAEREFKRAIALDPNLASQHLYGFYLAAMGRPSDAIPHFQHDKELAPKVAQKSYELAMGYNWTRQHDLAIAEAHQAVNLDPNFFLAYGELALAYTQQGLHDEALAELRKAPIFAKGHPAILGALGYSLAMAGQRAEAQKVLEELKDPAKFRFGCTFAIAKIHAALGENDQAFEWLQKACDNRLPHVIWLKVDPAMDNLRSDQRFGEFLQKMRLANADP